MIIPTIRIVVAFVNIQIDTQIMKSLSPTRQPCVWWQRDVLACDGARHVPQGADQDHITRGIVLVVLTIGIVLVVLRHDSSNRSRPSMDVQIEYLFRSIHRPALASCEITHPIRALLPHSEWKHQW